MIERKQYRGCLREGVRGEEMTEGLKAAEQEIRRMIREGALLAASLYGYGNMCFLYYEALRPGLGPEEFLGALTPFMEMWPEETGKTPWAYMYHIYHHSVPEDVKEWERNRETGVGYSWEEAGREGQSREGQSREGQSREGQSREGQSREGQSREGQSREERDREERNREIQGQVRGRKKTRIGRIAFVYPEKLFSYTYWHQAIVEEGLLKGDQYQCIALHENILFSYFEEPKTMVNIRKEPNLESEVIDQWMAVDPESHFDREKAGGNHFLIIEPMLSVGRGDL